MRHANKVLAMITLLVVVMAMAYFGAYFAIADCDPNTLIVVADDGDGLLTEYETEWDVSYSVGGQSAQMLFYPANQLDRKLRRSLWQGR